MFRFVRLYSYHWLMIAVVWLDVLGAGVAAERSQPTALTAAQQARLQERDRLQTEADQRVSGVRGGSSLRLSPQRR
jgi:hypothetical protein